MGVPILNAVQGSWYVSACFRSTLWNPTKSPAHWTPKIPGCSPRLQTSGRGAQKEDRNHHWSFSYLVVLKVRKDKACEVTRATDTWQSSTAPSASKFRPEFYQGTRIQQNSEFYQQGSQKGRAMGTWEQHPPSSPEVEPWVVGGWGHCSGPPRAVGALRAPDTQNWP